MTAVDATSSQPYCVTGEDEQLCRALQITAASSTSKGHHLFVA